MCPTFLDCIVDEPKIVVAFAGSYVGTTSASKSSTTNCTTVQPNKFGVTLIGQDDVEPLAPILQ